MKDLTGQELGNYRLLRLLAHDSSASVYFGEHKDNQSWAAVKLTGIRGENRHIEQWNAETCILRSLNHPHIVRMREFGMQDGMRFLVTDWAAQGTLLDLFAKSVPISMVAAYAHFCDISRWSNPSSVASFHCLHWYGVPSGT